MNPSVMHGQVDEDEDKTDTLLKPDVIYRVLRIYAFYISSAVGAYGHRLQMWTGQSSEWVTRHPETINNLFWICLYGA
jgi:hypothetical protein